MVDSWLHMVDDVPSFPFCVSHPEFKSNWPSTLLSDKEIHPTFPLWIPILQLQNATEKIRSFPKRAVLPQKLRQIGAGFFSG